MYEIHFRPQISKMIKRLLQCFPDETMDDRSEVAPGGPIYLEVGAVSVGEMLKKVGARGQVSGHNFAKILQLLSWIKGAQGAADFIEQEDEGVEERVLLRSWPVIGHGSQKTADGD